MMGALFDTLIFLAGVCAGVVFEHATCSSPARDRADRLEREANTLSSHLDASHRASRDLSKSVDRVIELLEDRL